MNDTPLLDWFNDTLFLGISATNWTVAIGVMLVTWLVLTVVLRFFVGRIPRLAGRTTTRVDDVLADVLTGTNRGLIFAVALLAGLGMLDLPEPWPARVSHLWFVAVALQVALWGTRAIRAGVKGYETRNAQPGTTHVSATATLMTWGLNTALWAVVLLSILANVGVNITAFVASLGVGGIAVALAVQNILGDLFASLSIAVDKPFEVGDFIVTTNIVGTVAHVGVRSTRVRALSGEQIVISNTELLKQTINNYKQMLERRIVFKFRVSYDTSADQAEEISRVVERVIRANEKVRFDRAHLLAFGPEALEYEVVYIVLEPDYNTYMDLQQRINLALMRELEQMGVSFGLPVRRLRMAGPVTVEQAQVQEAANGAS